MSSIVDIGAGKLDARTGMVSATCKGPEREDGSSEDFGSPAMAFALGFAAVPAPANGDGNAQGFLLDDVPGQDGVCVGAVDARTTSSYAELGPGETVMFATGDKYDSRVFCKDQLVCIIVGDDAAIVVDRKTKKISLASNSGAYMELSESNGAIMTSETGGSSIQCKGNVVSIKGTVVLGGMTPTMPLCASPTPVVGVTGSTVPTTGVFWGV